MDQGPALEQRREMLAAATGALSGIGQVLFQAGGVQLGGLLSQVDALGRLVEAARVVIVAEAIARGETDTGGQPGHRGWVAEHAPSLAVGGGATQLVTVALATADLDKAALKDAVTSGRVSVRNAAVCLAEMHRIGHRLTPAAVPTVWDAYLGLAAEHGPAVLRRLRPQLLARYGRDGELDRDQQRAAALVRLTHPGHGGDGLHEYTLVLDDAGTATLEAALGPVCAPCPSDAGPDLRPAGQRRADGLLTLIRRAVANPDGVPTSPKAQLVVTIDYDTLKDQLTAGKPATATTTTQPETDNTRTDNTGTDSTGTDSTGTEPGGQTTDPGPTGTQPTGTQPTRTQPTGTQSTGTGPTGTGPTGTQPTRTEPTGVRSTGTAPMSNAGPGRAGGGRAVGTTTAGPDSGTLLGPTTIRRIACEAGILPAVLARDGTVLDLGAEARFYTGAQAKALWLRDRHCTIPGCDMPAQWCDAHHLWHVHDGGPTDLDNGALLCGYHHAWVHRHRLAGRLIDGHVLWDLTPGSYDTYLAQLRANPAA